ncbi:MAG: SufB/SufD family protein, partial [Methanobacteriota archaeon]
MALSVDPKDAYVAAHDAFVASRDPREPAWLREARGAAIRRFREVGFPGAKQEEWKYTNLSPLLRVPFRVPSEDDPDGVVSEQVDPFTFGVLKTSLLTFVNGRFAPRMSYLRYLPRRVRVMSLAEAIEDAPETVRASLGRVLPPEGNGFSALNAAFLADGAVIDVPPKTVVEEPIHLLFLSRSKDEPLATHPRNLVVLGDGSAATVIETYAGWPSDVCLTNAVTEISVGAGASLGHYKMQREGERAFHMATMAVHQGRDSTVACHSFSFGGSLARSYVHTRFRGEGGSLLLNGLFMT